MRDSVRIPSLERGAVRPNPVEPRASIGVVRPMGTAHNGDSNGEANMTAIAESTTNIRGSLDALVATSTDLLRTISEVLDVRRSDSLGAISA